MNILTHGLDGSGIFLKTSSSNEESGICNPAVWEELRNSYAREIHAPSELTTLRALFGKKRRFNPLELAAYAAATVRVAAAVIAFPADCRIAPLRGAARPCMLTEVMSKGKVRFELLDFVGGSLGRRDTEIVNALRAILRRNDLGRDLYRIQVVDTSIGGNGIDKLARLLLAVHRSTPCFSKQNWVLDIRLLSAATKNDHFKMVSGVEELSTDRVKFVVTRYPVPKLIAEDFVDSVGFEIEEASAGCVIRSKVVPGKFLIDSEHAPLVIESNDLSRTFQEFLCEAVTDSLLNDQGFKLTKVVWRNE